MKEHRETDRTRTPWWAAWIGAALLALAPATLTAGTSMEKDSAMTSAEIESAIETEMLFDPSVALNDIDIHVRKGHVTLTGTVDNLLARERAHRLAETVRGVKTVINRVTVEPIAPVSDTEIHNDVRNALLVDPATESYEVSVRVDDGRLTLKGTVDSWQERSLVEKTAMGIKGVRSVDNRILVDPPETRSDHEILEEVQAALSWDTLVDQGLVEVTVNNGVVRLTGTVGSAAERRRAIADAWVAGVRRVEAKHLDVEHWARHSYEKTAARSAPADEEIHDAVHAALATEPRLSRANLTVKVDNGVVTLQGTVETLKAQRVAAETARRTMGVSRVKNRLRVRPETGRPDNAIANDIERLLRIDPHISRHEVEIRVVDGTAYLTGTVDTFYERAEADDATARVEGVTRIVNNLAVDSDLLPLVYDPYVYDWYAPDFAWYVYERTRTFKSDVAILDDVNDQLFWSPFVDSDEVAVTVDDGVVTLTGTVDSWAELRAATENAFEGGAVWVDNDLNVAAGMGS